MSDALVGLIADLEEEEAIARVRTRLEQGEPPSAIIEDCQTGLSVVGDRYREGTYFIAGLIMAGEIFREVMEILEPLVGPGAALDAAHAGGPTAGKVLIATVQGDIHDLGKNLLVMLLRAMNFEVVDLGVDVAVSGFVEAVRQNRPQVLGLSALLTTTMAQMRTVLRALEEAGLRSGLKVMVGGAPVTQRYADDIGADGFGADANSAVGLVSQWCQPSGQAKLG